LVPNIKTSNAFCILNKDAVPVRSKLIAKHFLWRFLQKLSYALQISLDELFYWLVPCPSYLCTFVEEPLINSEINLGNERKTYETTLIQLEVEVTMSYNMLLTPMKFYK
jgi:hypothetical protein